jgi:hypothetical protein
MRADFALFHERLAQACLARQVAEPKLAASIGLSPRRAIIMSLTGPGSLDLDRVCQIADVLDVSVDWLVGRTNIMDLLELPELRGPAPSKRRRTKKTA